MRTVNTLSPEALETQYDALYEQYGRPLEREHSGLFLAVSQRGETLVGTDLSEVSLIAGERFGPGVFVYRIGERTVGKMW